MSFETIEDMFQLAINVERLAKTLYLGLEDMFADHPEVAHFWHHYADEEEGHAAWLEQTLARLSPEQRETQGDLVIVEKLRHISHTPIKSLLAGIANLEDAFQLVNDLENSETNVVFEFLVENFADDEDTRRFLKNQLRNHVGNLLIEFPTQFRSAAIRRSIQVRRLEEG
ncbi:MAG: hypothetical protein JXA21_02625 [Anaerolineae bacterium]|nr:hypothetical protein [Anaerolineae bacterium]